MSNKPSKFWCNWLFSVSIFVILFSLVMAFLPKHIQIIYNLLFFSGSKTNPLTNPTIVNYVFFLYSILGAVMIGWSIALLYLIQKPFRDGQAFAWSAIFFSVLFWYIIDSIQSIGFGFWENVIFNTVFFLLFLIPLVKTYKDF